MSLDRRDDPAPDVEQRSFVAASPEVIEPMTDSERTTLESLLDAAYSVQFCRNCEKPHAAREDVEACSCYSEPSVSSESNPVFVPQTVMVRRQWLRPLNSGT